jgi:EmrB/QacA subfamily drug resistance transporter
MGVDNKPATPITVHAADSAQPAVVRRGPIVAVLAMMQFVFVLDATIVNIALPTIQDDLAIPSPSLAWVVNAYVVMAGGLLLLGGRLADRIGRRTMFVVALLMFGVASTVSGLAGNGDVLIASRFVQGAGEAMGVPAALGIILHLFRDPAERVKILGLWGGLAGLAGTLGVVASGVVTDLGSWRGLFLINVPIAVVALVAARRLLGPDRADAPRREFDIAGAVLATAAVASLVFGLLSSVDHAWTSIRVLAPLAISAAAAIGLAAIEARSQDPLLPLRIIAHRTRAASYLAIAATGFAFFSYVYVITLFQQQVLGYSPMRGGLSNLPLGVAIGIGVGLAAGLFPKLGPRLVAGLGLVGCAGGFALTAQMSLDTTYAGGILPGMVLFGICFGLVSATAANTAFAGIGDDEFSLGSAVQGVAMQVGGVIGLAVTATIALRYGPYRSGSDLDPLTATTHGYAVALVAIAGVLLVAAGLVVALVRPVAENGGVSAKKEGTRGNAV